jgi:hypothetical protein
MGVLSLAVLPGATSLNIKKEIMLSIELQNLRATLPMSMHIIADEQFLSVKC